MIQIEDDGVVCNSPKAINRKFFYKKKCVTYRQASFICAVSRRALVSILGSNFYRSKIEFGAITHYTALHACGRLFL
ncbi:hypothetical protein VAL01S_06_03670 [Vibrio alginolyticus NBRC 15630 = ATCC 17749]|nr:hypothetical protein YZOS03_19970 [Vibrio alginolyticus]GAD71198.1 hypothetical protein VAL01S_06_03670 [Vibrio alginolyticus NBRC 15630 = ATCC 17749]